MNLFRWIALALSCAASSGCALDPYHVEDPTSLAHLGPKVPDIVKSLRCEVVSFLELNKIRSVLAEKANASLLRALADRNKGEYERSLEVYRKFKHIDIDSTQFAGLVVDVKNVDTFNFSLGYDWKKPSSDAKGLTLGSLLKTTDSRDYHVGPSYQDTRTFELFEQGIIAQNTDLGPAKDFSPDGSKPPSASRFSSAFFRQPSEDQDFYCYSALPDPGAADLEKVEHIIDNLSSSSEETRALEHFHRTFVGYSQKTLASWLLDAAAAMASNQFTVFPTQENIINGQLEYTFTLDAKPGLDLKYTLVAALTNPLVPEVSGSVEHAATFSIYLNGSQSAQAFLAKNGSSCNLGVRNAALTNASCKPPGASLKAKH